MSTREAFVGKVARVTFIKPAPPSTTITGASGIASWLVVTSFPGDQSLFTSSSKTY